VERRRKIFNNSLADKFGVGGVPRTVLLPANPTAPDTNDKSFVISDTRWIGKRFSAYVGWPRFFKPFAGGGWNERLSPAQSGRMYRAYSETGLTL